MVRVGLQINATLENVEELETCHPNYSFFIKIKCTNCGEASEKWHDITESERSQQDSRNPDGFNFYMKCKMCSRENTIDIVEKTNAYMDRDRPSPPEEVRPLTSAIAEKNGKLILGCDANARHTLWGRSENNKREYVTRNLVPLELALNIDGVHRTINIVCVYYAGDEPAVPRELQRLVEHCNKLQTPLLVECDANAHNVIWWITYTNIRAKYTQDDTGKFKTIVIFDCRGAEPTEFSPRSGWIVKSAENGQTFENVDISEDDWVEYDQKNNNSVGIYEFSSQFIKLKK